MISTEDETSTEYDLEVNDYSPTPASGLKNTSPILRKSTVSGICIPAAFIRLPRRRSIGPIGAGISKSTAIWMPPNRSTMTF